MRDEARGEGYVSGEEREGGTWGDGFWTKAWKPRTPVSCLFSSLLAIQPNHSDQHGWHHNYSRQLHVLLTFCPPLTCQAAFHHKSGGFVTNGSNTDRNNSCQSMMCMINTNPKPRTLCSGIFSPTMGFWNRKYSLFRKTSNSNNNASTTK